MDLVAGFVKKGGYSQKRAGSTRLKDPRKSITMVTRIALRMLEGWNQIARIYFRLPVRLEDGVGKK